MPSILSEIAFLTNVEEADLLRGPAYRQQIAEALFNGIMRYQQSLKAATETVASQ
jgi:N-acetylmuramoyl-L-alanine amidase